MHPIPQRNLLITGVDPPRPVEHQPVRIGFTLDNLMMPLRAGRVAVLPDGAPLPLAGLGESAHFAGMLDGFAPPAGRQQQMRIGLYDDDSPVYEAEILQPNITAVFALDVGATYTVLFDSYHVERPRALKMDDNGMWATAKVGDQGLDNPNPRSPFDPPGQGIQSRYIGGSEAGDTKKFNTAKRRLVFGPVALAPDSPALEFAYQVVNAGYGKRGEDTWHQVTDGLSSIAKNVLTGLYPSFAAAWEGLDSFTQILNNLEFADCDGIVAMDAVNFEPQRLADVTAENDGSWTETRNYPGFKSHDGCGRNSIYDATWTVTRTSYTAPGGGAAGAGLRAHRRPRRDPGRAARG
jgi:hypothetical protein